MNPFQSLSDYEEFVYTLPQRVSHVARSTLVVARRGRGIATVTGEIYFDNGHRLAVYEILTKHNRIPAPGIQFDAPNLPYLIDEIVRRGILPER